MSDNNLYALIVVLFFGMAITAIIADCSMTTAKQQQQTQQKDQPHE